jgi:hypothetical protein
LCFASQPSTNFIAKFQPKRCCLLETATWDYDVIHWWYQRAVAGEKRLGGQLLTLLVSISVHSGRSTLELSPKTSVVSVSFEVQLVVRGLPTVGGRRTRRNERYRIGIGGLSHGVPAGQAQHELSLAASFC